MSLRYASVLLMLVLGCTTQGSVTPKNDIIVKQLPYESKDVKSVGNNWYTVTCTVDGSPHRFIFRAWINTNNTASIRDFTELSDDHSSKNR